MQRKSVLSQSNVVSIDSARFDGPNPSPDGATPTVIREKRTSVYANQHSASRFMRLVYGPMDYGVRRDGLRAAARESGHDMGLGWLEIVNLGRREWERKVRGIAA